MGEGRASLLFKTLQGLALSHLSNDCQPVSDVSRRLQSSGGAFTWVVLCTSTLLSDRLLAVAGPQVWNMLRASLRVVDNNRCIRWTITSGASCWQSTINSSRNVRWLTSR